MALIECEDCNKQMSETAMACPHCGSSIQYQKKYEEVSNHYLKSFLWGGVVGIAILIFMIMSGAWD